MQYFTCLNFDNETLEKFIDFYSFLINEGETNAVIFIDSFGGELHAAESIVSIIESSNITFHTVGLSKIFSAGLYLMSHGDIRYAVNRSTFMIHEPSKEIYGSSSVLDVEASRVAQQREQYLGDIAKKSKKKVEWWKSQINKQTDRDFYFDVQKALEYGIIDYIGIPEIQSSQAIMALNKE